MLFGHPDLVANGRLKIQGKTHMHEPTTPTTTTSTHRKAYLAAECALEDSGIALAHEVGRRRRRLRRRHRSRSAYDARGCARRGAELVVLRDGGSAARGLAVAAVRAANAAAGPARGLM